MDLSLSRNIIRKQDRLPVEQLAGELDRFFQAIPTDRRYHLEIRTPNYLEEPVFEVLEKHGVGQIFSQWTWLPSLKKQYEKSGGRIFNAGKQFVIRLLTPIGMRYDETYAKAFPFDKLVDDLFKPVMVEEAVNLVRDILAQDAVVYLIINNRAGWECADDCGEGGGEVFGRVKLIVSYSQILIPIVGS